MVNNYQLYANALDFPRKELTFGGRRTPIGFRRATSPRLHEPKSRADGCGLQAGTNPILVSGSWCTRSGPRYEVQVGNLLFPGNKSPRVRRQPLVVRWCKEQGLGRRLTNTLEKDNQTSSNAGGIPVNAIRPDHGSQDPALNKAVLRSRRGRRLATIRTGHRRLLRRTLRRQQTSPPGSKTVFAVLDESRDRTTRVSLAELAHRPLSSAGRQVGSSGGPAPEVGRCSRRGLRPTPSALELCRGWRQPR